MNGQFKNIAGRPVPLSDGRVIGPDDEPFELVDGTGHDQLLEDSGLIARVPSAVQAAEKTDDPKAAKPAAKPKEKS